MCRGQSAILNKHSRRKSSHLKSESGSSSETLEGRNLLIESSKSQPKECQRMKSKSHHRHRTSHRSNAEHKNLNKTLVRALVCPLVRLRAVTMKTLITARYPKLPTSREDQERERPRHPAHRPAPINFRYDYDTHFRYSLHEFDPIKNSVPIMQWSEPQLTNFLLTPTDKLKIEVPPLNLVDSIPVTHFAIIQLVNVVHWTSPPSVFLSFYVL